jgi:uncharacterized membrane protein YfcA
MSRVVIGLFAGALWTLIFGCISGEWDTELGYLIALNAVIGGLIGAAVSAWNSPPILIGIAFGLVGSFAAAVVLGSREGPWSVFVWVLIGLWGGVSGLLTGIVIRVLKPRQGGWNW